MPSNNEKANGGGGWRSRFGSSRRSEKGVDAQSINLVNQQRELAAQHIARQQRTVKGGAAVELGSARIEEYERGNGVAETGRSLSKADRLTGNYGGDEHGFLTNAPLSKTVQRNVTSDADKDDDCPVCLEPLSFRLAGEKNHVVPRCGHALHHACFTAVYGSPELVLAAQTNGEQRAAPGMCGVCRKLITLAQDGVAGGMSTGKAKSMMGYQAAAAARDDGDRLEQNFERSATHSMGHADEGDCTNDPVENDEGPARNVHGPVSRPLPALQRSASAGRDQTDWQDRSMVLPIIQVRPEFQTLVRTKRPREIKNAGETQNLVCVVSIQVPPRRRRLRMEENESVWRQKCEQYAVIRSRSPVEAEKQQESAEEPQRDDDEVENYNGQRDAGEAYDDEAVAVHSSSSSSSSSSGDEGFSYSATPAVNSNKASSGAVIDDLKQRVIDWKGHSIEKFGDLIVYDHLGVRQDAVMRDFHVYLFREALLCVSEERKKERGLARLIGATTSQEDASSGSSHSRSSKAALKLKGRIWIRHIRLCRELDIDGLPCLTIRLDDEALDHFVLCFKEHSERKTWKSKINRLLKEKNLLASKGKDTAMSSTTTDTSIRRKAFNELPLAAAGSLSKNLSYGSLTTSSSIKQMGASLNSSDSKNTLISSPTTSSVQQSPPSKKDVFSTLPVYLTNLPQHQQWSASGGLDPNAPLPDMLPHTPIDLVIMVSVPSVTVQPAVSSSTVSSSAALKLRLIRSTLDFVIANVGPRDRIALVSYNVGVGGQIRRTALLNASKSASRQRLEMFVDSIGQPWTGAGEDPFHESFENVGGMSGRTDTVTAINVGFDIVLQRKSKNPTTSMLLINDTADAPKRGQMDLIMARGEAANVPVHCFGFGKRHDPSSLWLISNHTRGSYTFVKEWYQLRECVAGCLGALMSIALTDIKVHISLPINNHFRVRRVSGCTGTIVSSSGKDVDLTLAELRFGEAKELLLELELDFGALLSEREANRDQANSALSDPELVERGSATDDFMQRLGLEGLSIAEARRQPMNVKKIFSDGSTTTNGSESGFDSHRAVGSKEADSIDDVAVLEVHCGCRDPNVGITKHQIGDPCVLTLEVDCAENEGQKDVIRTSTAIADPIVTRRRLEILVSDMITRSLLLVSRGNNAQAAQILLETRKIVDTVLRTIPTDVFAWEDNDAPLRRQLSIDGKPSVPFQTQAALYATQTRNSHARKQRRLMHRRTALSLIAITEDLDVLIDGLEMSKAISFERSERNFGAQQAMVLRDQKAWTSRSDTEWNFFCTLDNGPTFAALAAQHAATYGR